MTFWDRLKMIVGGVARVADVVTPSSCDAPARTYPPGHYGDQLLSDREREAKWRRHAERQQAEARAEAEQRRQAAEVLERELAHSPMPLHAVFPAPGVAAHPGLESLFDFMNQMHRRW